MIRQSVRKMRACKRRLVRECFEQLVSPVEPGWYIIELMVNGQSIGYFFCTRLSASGITTICVFE